MPAVLDGDHRRTFRVELRVRGQCFATGEGRTIKLAQQEAAQAALAAPDFIANVAAARPQDSYIELEGSEAEAMDTDAVSSELVEPVWEEALSEQIEEDEIVEKEDALARDA